MRLDDVGNAGLNGVLITNISVVGGDLGNAAEC